MADPRPVHHTTSSAISTAGWEATKGVGKAIALVLGVGAAVGGILPALAGASGAWVLGGALVGAAVTGIGTSAILGMPAVLAAGGLVGLMKGGDRISRENQEFARRTDRANHVEEVRMSAYANQAMQQGYQAGLQDGAQQVMNQLQQMQYAAIQQEMQAQHAKNHPEGHAAKVAAARAAHAAGPQIS